MSNKWYVVHTQTGAERKAKANGIAMMSVVNSGGMHILHLWTQGLAKRGLFALGAWNGGPDAVVPFNGTKGILGTNPMTYGFPGDKGDIVIELFHEVWRQQPNPLAQLRSIQGRNLVAHGDTRLGKTRYAARDFDHSGTAPGLRGGRRDRNDDDGPPSGCLVEAVAGD